MNIVIPIGGIGLRFKKEGFDKPKPLINVLGVPMIFRVIKGLNTSKDDTIHIVYNSELNYFSFKESIYKEFPDRNFRFVELEKKTKGAAETILLGIRNLDEDTLEEPFLILDCDTFYEDDIINEYRKTPNKNTIFYFEDTDNNPIFSYIKVGSGGNVEEIKEKIKISDFANTGAYGFNTGRLLLEYAKKILNDEGELYVSRIYHEMLLRGEKITSKKIENFSCVGTPLQLRIFCETKSSISPVRVCFDLDNTLVTYPKIPNDYTTVSPISKNIEYLKFLKDKGSYIIIYTARRMKTHKGNVGAIVADVGKITLDTLEKFGIPYDEIHFGKPHADFYVDDLGVNAFDDLDKNLGFYKTQSDPRHFNQVRFEEDSVIKLTANKGEIYWYTNIPKMLKEYCPHIIEADLESGYIKMERIKGINYSYLYLNNALQTTDLQELIDFMKYLHSFYPYEALHENIYSNYVSKIEKRYSENSNLYSKIKNAQRLYDKIIIGLEEYEKEKRGSFGIIHGDPVFSNLIMTDRGFRMIDPRGKIGDEFSIYGDSNYDFAKVYQSIMGYDHILNEKEIDLEYRERMLSTFEVNFQDKQMEDIRLITASLFFSLIPLHVFSEKKFSKYISIAETLVQ